MTVVGEAFVKLSPDDADFGDRAERSIVGSISGASKKAALAAGAALATATAAAGAALVKVGGDFNAAFNTIRQGTGATGDALEGLKDDFRAVFGGVATDMDTAATTVADLNTRLGATGEQAQELATRFINLEKLTGEDISTSVEKITRLFGDWGVATEDQAETMDKLFRASQAAGIGVNDLSQLVVQFGAPLRQLGLSLEEGAALFAKWNKEGVNTEIIFSGVRSAISKFAREGKDIPETFRAVTDEIMNAGDASKATTLAIENFGSEAGPDLAAAIREGRFEIEDLVSAIENGDDTINGLARETEGLGDKFTRLKNNVFLLIEPVATRLFDGLLAGVDKAIELVQRFGPVVKRAFSGIVEFLRPVGETIGSLFGGIFGPARDFVSQVGSAAATVFGGGTPARTSAAPPPGLGPEAEKAAKDGVVKLGEVSQKEWQRLLDAGWVGRAGDLQEALYPPNPAQAASAPMVEAFETIRETAIGVSGTIRTAFAGVRDFVAPIAARIQEAWLAYVNWVVNDAAPRIAGAWRATVGGAINFIKDTVIPGVQQAWGSLVSGFEGTGGEGSFFTDLGEAAATVHQWFSNTLVPFVQNTLVPAWQDDFLPVLEDVADFIKRNLTPVLGGLGGVLLAAVSPVAAAIAGFVVAYQRFEGFRDVVQEVVGFAQRWIPVIAEVLGEVFEFIITEVVPVVAQFAKHIISSIGDAVTWVQENFGLIKEAVSNVLKAVAVVVAVILGPIVLFFSEWGDEILAIIKAVWDTIRLVIDTAVRLIRNVLTIFLAVLAGDWGKAWEAIKDTVDAIWDLIVGLIKNFTKIVFNIIKGSLEGILTLFRTGWDAVFEFVKKIPGRMAGFMNEMTETVLGIITTTLNKVPELIKGYFNAAVDFIKGIPDRIKLLAGDWLKAGQFLIEQLGEGLKAAVRATGDIGRAIANSIVGFVNSNVIDKINSAVEFTIDPPIGPSFTIDPPDIPHIPRFQRGGVVRGSAEGVLAVVGDVGPGRDEAVLPLRKGVLEALERMAQGGGQSIQVVVQAPVPPDRANALGRSIGDGLASTLAARRIRVGV